MKDVLHKVNFSPEDAPMLAEQLGLKSENIQYIQQQFKGDSEKTQESILTAWHTSLKGKQVTWEVFVQSLINCSYSCDDIKLYTSETTADTSITDKWRGEVRNYWKNSLLV